MQYMTPAAVETPEPQPSVATENGETLALTTGMGPLAPLLRR